MSEQIEMMGIIKLKDCLIRSKYLIPHINENDKTPSWDGFIFLYSNGSKNKKKSDLVARIPVQVKGKTNSDIFCEYIEQNVVRADLKNYIKEGGILYFVILLRDADNYRIYYDNLTTLKISRYLKKMRNRNSINITLTTFPKENIDNVTDIFINFSHDLGQKVSEKHLSLEELKNNTPVGVDSISIHYQSVQHKHPIDYFLDNETVVYANYSSTGISFQVDHIKVTEFGQTVYSPILVENIEYYPTFRLSYSKEGTKVIIGNSISFLHQKDTKKVVFNLKFSGTLSQRIKDTEFLLALLNYKSYSAGGENPHTFSFIEEGIEGLDFNESIEHYNDYLQHLHEIKQVLEILKVKEEIDLDCKTVKDEENLHILITGILYKKSQDLVISREIKNNISRVDIKICNLTIALIVAKENDDKYTLKNYFASSLSGYYDIPGSDKTIIVPIYLSLGEDSFLTISNIDYDDMYRSFDMLEASDELFGMTYQFILTMINAYDKSKKQILLDTSLKLLDWMYNSEHGTNNAIYLLNKLQIIKRTRNLSEPEISQLRKIISDNSDDKILTGTYILLEDKDMAKLHFDKMSKFDQGEFKKLPIIIFLENKFDA